MNFLLNKLQNMSFANRITLISTVSLALVLGLITFYVVQDMYNSESEKAEELSINMSRSLAAEVSEAFNKNIEFLHTKKLFIEAMLSNRDFDRDNVMSFMNNAIVSNQMLQGLWVRVEEGIYDDVSNEQEF